jgi:hypothetical protein
MTILRRLPPPRPAPLLLLLQNPLGPQPDPASPRLLRRRLGTIPPSHVDPNDADGSHDPGQRPGTHRNRTLSSGTHQLTAKLHAHRLAVPGYPQGQLASRGQGPLEDLQLPGHHQEHPLGCSCGPTASSLPSSRLTKRASRRRAPISFSESGERNSTHNRRRLVSRMGRSVFTAPIGSHTWLPGVEAMSADPLHTSGHSFAETRSYVRQDTSPRFVPRSAGYSLKRPARQRRRRGMS